MRASRRDSPGQGLRSLVVEGGSLFRGDLLGFLGLLLAIGTSHMVYGHGPFSMENALLTGLVLGVPGGILIAWPAKGMPLPPVAAVRPERSVA